MYLTITLSEWLEDTRHWRRRRGERLRRLDTALERYENLKKVWFDDLQATYRPDALREQMRLVDVAERTARSEVQEAFKAWARAKGNWRKDERNEKKMFTRLHQELTYLGGSLDAASRNALNELKEARDQSIVQIFTGSKMVVGKPNTLRRLLRQRRKVTKLEKSHRELQAGTSNASVNEKTEQAVETGRQVAAVFGDAFDIPNVTGIPQALLAVTEAAGEAAADLAKDLVNDFQGALAEAMPGLSIAYSGVRFARACKNAYKAKTKQEWLYNKLEVKLEDSEPRAAVEALRRLYLRKEDQAVIDSTRFAGSLSVSVGNAMTLGLLTPLQVGYAATNTALGLAQKLYVLGREIQELGKVNRILNSGRFDRTLLTACPLLGAYYLTTMPQSHVIMQLVDPSQPTFLDDVEYIRRHEFEKLLRSSRKIIAGSYIWLRKGDGKQPFQGLIPEGKRERASGWFESAKKNVKPVLRAVSPTLER